MEKKIFFSSDAQSGAQQIVLPPDEAHHAAKVLRCVQDEEVEILNGRGYRFCGIFTKVNPKESRLTVVNEEFVPKPAKTPAIGLALLKKRERLEWFIEKAVELGVGQVWLFRSQYAEKGRIGTERLERIAIAGAKQSGNPWLCKIRTDIDFEEMIAQFETPGCIAHCHTDGLPHLQQGLAHTGSAVLIGPEGDFSTEEVALAEAKGWQSVSLGPLRLRAETAALYAAVLLQMKTYI